MWFKLTKSSSRVVSKSDLTDGRVISGLGRCRSYPSDMESPKKQRLHGSRVSPANMKIAFKIVPSRGTSVAQLLVDVATAGGTGTLTQVQETLNHLQALQESICIGHQTTTLEGPWTHSQEPGVSHGSD